MNQKQREYALGRITMLVKNTLSAVKADMTTPAKRISDSERANLILAGKVPYAKDLESVSTYSRVGEVLDLSKFEWSDHIKDNERYEQRCAEVHRLGEDAKDQVMLGDAVGAQDAISKLAEALGTV